MNIELNNEGNKYSFDVDPNKGVDYLTEIAIRVFSLQRNSFNLKFQSRILPREDIPLKEIFNHYSSRISINIELIYPQRKSSLKQEKYHKSDRPILNELNQQININCFCNKSSFSSAYCPTCNIFLCSQCLQKHLKTHPTLTLTNSSNSIALYQKNLFSRLNTITNANQTNSKSITEMNDNIIDILSQSKASINDIIERVNVIELSMKNGSMLNDNGLITTIKQQILSNHNDKNGKLREDDIESSFKELNKVDIQIRELETMKGPLRLHVQFLSKVQKYSLLINNSINDLVNHLKGIINDSKDKREDIIKRMHSFINTNYKYNNDISERMKSHDRYYSSLISINSPMTLSPICNERNMHDQITSETSSLSYQNQMNYTPSNNKESSGTDSNYINTKKEQLNIQLNISKRLLARNVPVNTQKTNSLNLENSIPIKKTNAIMINNHLSPCASHINGLNLNMAIGKKLIQIKEQHKQKGNCNNNDSNSNTNSNTKPKDINIIPVNIKNQFRSSIKLPPEDRSNEENRNYNNNINHNNNFCHRESRQSIIHFTEKPVSKVNKKSFSSLNPHSKTEQNDETRTLINNLKVIPDKKLMTIKEFSTEKAERKNKKFTIGKSMEHINSLNDDYKEYNNKRFLTVGNSNENTNNNLTTYVNSQNQNPLLLSLSKLTSRSRSLRKKRKMINKYDFLI